MSAIPPAIVLPLLTTSKVAVGATLTYFGAAMRKGFLVIFGSAILLMVAAHFLDVTWTAGHEADIVVSLAVSLLFAFSILPVTGVVREHLWLVCADRSEATGEVGNGTGASRKDGNWQEQVGRGLRIIICVSIRAD
jgi:hypothetical protein